MRLIISIFSIIHFGLLTGQTPLEMDSTGNVVYYGEFPLEKGKEAKAEDIFTRLMNLNFKERGNPIFFKNPATHHFEAKCYFKMPFAPYPIQGVCNFTWSFLIKEGKMNIYLHNIYWYADQQRGGPADLQSILSAMSAEMINDNAKSYLAIANASDKIDSQMKHYIEIFKESLALLDK
jgi:hypothetical protein